VRNLIQKSDIKTITCKNYRFFIFACWKKKM